MAEERQEVQAEESVQEVPKKGKGKKLILIIVIATLLVGGGVAYTFLGGKLKKTETAETGSKKDKPKVLIPLDPFVLNLAEQGRYLKVSIQLELSDPTSQEAVKSRLPLIRDAVITLVSSKSAESISSPEGKFQLKDELLLRANQAMEKDVFKNLYFTDFVMQ